MKKLTVPALLMLLFLACQKSDKVNPKIVSKPKDTVVKPVYDTIPDGGYVYFHLTLDSQYYARIGFEFDHTAHLGSFESDLDAGYMDGQDPVIGYAVSVDNQVLEVSRFPYSRGVSSRIHVARRFESGPLYLKIAAETKIPPTIHVWCKDNYLKDSLDVSHGAHYNFNVDNNNPNTYGDNRIQIVFWSDKKN